VIESPLSGFPVVGVGASAGGLEAFTQLLKALPEDTGMAFVFVLHLDPEHKSMLPEILGRATRMLVAQAADGDQLEPNRVYIIPPNTDLSVENLVLRLSHCQEVRRPHLAVDHFLRSLAEDQGARAIGIVLSGTGSDGALGLEFIKSKGGITFAQRPDSAKHDGMPQAAVETGCVDLVLSPEEIAGELVRLRRHPYVQLAEAEKIEDVAFAEDELRAVFSLLRSQSNVDFTYYKHSTVRRRILRRMALHKIETFNSYVDYLKSQPEEVKALYHDILINVTNFFRDPQVFEGLKQRLLPTIIKNRGAGAPIRVWVPGCSTGEEVYSIAMCLMEVLPSPLAVPPQIFATDISDAVLEKARSAVYRDSISLDVSPERLSRFFVKLPSGGYQVAKAIREWCVFARQNVVRDPPFSRLDLISCRNLLIYLEPVLQKQILALFHYALTPSGFLMLGGSESIGTFTEFFTLEDKKLKFFSRKQTPTRASFDYSLGAEEPHRTAVAKRPENGVVTGVDVQKAADLMLLARAPASVLINEDLQILQFRGHTGDYLEPAPGNASFNLLKMARPGLLMALRTAIHEAKQTGLPVRQDNVVVESGPQRKLVDIDVLPVRAATSRAHFLVLFKEKEQPPSPPIAPSDTNTPSATAQFSAERQIEQLQHELTATKDFLLATSEEQQSTTEELKASNEEILSSNEELQSTNEELETAKEELQCSNEELKTINEELQNSLEQTAHTKAYMETVVDHMSKALVVLDKGLVVQKVNQAFCRMFRSSPSEAESKLIYDLGNGQWNILVLRELLEKVLPVDRETELKDFEVTHEFPLIGRRTMLLDAHHIHWGSEQGEMILLGIADITERKQADLLLREQEHRLRLAVEATQLGMWDYDPTSGRMTWSELCHTILGQPTEATYDAFMARVQPEDRERVHQCAQLALDPQGSGKYEAEYRVLWPDGSIHWVAARGQTFFQDSGGQRRAVSVTGTVHDVSEYKQREERERLLVAEKAANRAKDEFIATVSHELRTPLTAISLWAKMLRAGQVDPQKAAKGLEVIERSAKTQGQLIEDLLDVSRIIAGKLSISMQPFDLKPVLDAALNMVRPVAEAKGVHLQPDLDPAVVQVMGDAQRMQQIVCNLLTNAVKFTPKDGCVGLKVECSENAGEGRIVRIRVMDTGIGISADFLPHVFERFRQADGKITRECSGLGLGLAIVRHLVELHHGTVMAQSAGEGKGATFTVTLPILTAPKASGRFHRRAAQDAGEASLSLKGLRILTVEDDVDTQECIRTVLESSGAELRIVRLASEAFEIVQHWRPDILVCDIGLPGEDGYSLMRRIRGLEPANGGQTPALALTAYARDEDRATALAAGFQEHMAKPPEPAELVGVVVELVSQVTK
jgi:two-component system CheB/CheR fusion protein